MAMMQAFPAALQSAVPAVESFQLKMWVEVEHDALAGFRGRDLPFAVLVRRVLRRVTGWSDVTRVAGVEVSATLLT